MAVTFNNPDTRARMLALAHDFDQLAEVAEELEEMAKKDGEG